MKFFRNCQTFYEKISSLSWLHVLWPIVMRPQWGNGCVATCVVGACTYAKVFDPVGAGGTYQWGLAPVIGGLDDCLVDAGHDVVHIVIRHVGAGGEAEADLKEFFLYTIGVNRGSGIHGLFMDMHTLHVL